MGRPQNLSKWITPVSGIVGCSAADGGPVNVEELEAMTDFLAYRGPDGKAILAEHCAGFGHTLLRTTGLSPSEGQPAVLDTFWITADARLDCREELIGETRGCGQTCGIKRFRRHADPAELRSVGTELCGASERRLFIRHMEHPRQRVSSVSVTISESNPFTTPN